MKWGLSGLHYWMVQGMHGVTNTTWEWCHLEMSMFGVIRWWTVCHKNSIFRITKYTFAEYSFELEDWNVFPCSKIYGTTHVDVVYVMWSSEMSLKSCTIKSEFCNSFVKALQELCFAENPIRIGLIIPKDIDNFAQLKTIRYKRIFILINL